MPWKNGKGETREIALDAHQPFRWRLSTATVEESAEFSPFPGYDRKLVFLHGTQADFEIDGTQRKLTPWEVVGFAGEASVRAQVQNTSEDLNLFSLRESARAGLHIAQYRAQEEVQFPLQGEEHFVCALRGAIDFLESTTGAKGRLQQGETLWVSRYKELNLLNLRTRASDAPAVCAWGIITLTKATAAPTPSNR